MPSVLLKDLPGKLHRRLRERAARHRRSLSKEVIVILERAVEDRAGPPPLAEIDRLRVRGARPLTRDLIEGARRIGRP